MNNNFIRSNQNNNNKNRNRNRNNNNNRRNTGGGNLGGGGSNKVFDSNGPDIKLRGTTQTIAEKYMQLGRDAQSSGDSVAAENYYQHAEHYYRLWAANQPVGQSLIMSRKLGEEEFDEEGSEENSGGDEETEGNTSEAAPVESVQPADTNDVNAQGEGQQQRPFRNNNYRDNNTRNQRPRWQNNRNNRNPDTAPSPEQGAVPVVETPFEAHPVSPTPSPVVDEAPGQWEAPSFLQRAAPVAAVEDTPVVATEDVAAPRKYRPRKPKIEAETVPANEDSSNRDE